MKSKTKQAQRLRINQTSAEKIIWHRLRNRQLDGLKFRRQHNIENFIVDFYCAEISLIVEIDGDVHGYKNKIKKDETREAMLKAKNLGIVRYTNHEVYDNLDGVLENLFNRCKELKDKKQTPSP